MKNLAAGFIIGGLLILFIFYGAIVLQVLFLKL